MTDQIHTVWCTKCQKWSNHAIDTCPGPDPSRRRPETVPETKARLDRLKRNLIDGQDIPVILDLETMTVRPVETIPDEQAPQWHHDTLNWWSTRYAPRS